MWPLSALVEERGSKQCTHLPPCLFLTTQTSLFVSSPNPNSNLEVGRTQVILECHPLNVTHSHHPWWMSGRCSKLFIYSFIHLVLHLFNKHEAPPMCHKCTAHFLSNQGWLWEQNIKQCYTLKIEALWVHRSPVWSWATVVGELHRKKALKLKLERKIISRTTARGRWRQHRWERNPLPLGAREIPSWSEEQSEHPTVLQHIRRLETKDRGHWKIWRCDNKTWSAEKTRVRPC